MSSHNSEPFESDLDRLIRDSLLTAADSVEPGSNGLERIRAKIIVRRAARASRWRIAPGRGAAGWRPFQVTGAWLTAMTEAVVERFKPDPNRAGWFGWLRPAAAIATGVFVVTAASLAVAALPAAIAPVNNSRHYHSPTPAPSSLSGHRHRPGYSSSGGSAGSSGPGGENGNSGGGTPSCSPPASTSPSASTTPSQTPSETPSTSSPSTTPSTGTPTPTTSDSSLPLVTPTTSVGQNEPPSPSQSQSPDGVPAQSPEATGKALLDAVSSTELGGTNVQVLPTATQTPVAPSPVPSATVTPQPSQPGGTGPC
jgi:hypothetical protein